MEKIESVCVMRDLVKAVGELQDGMQRRFGVSLNEAMALCCIGWGVATAGEIARNTGLAAPGASKVIRSVEEKGLVGRRCGCDDRRRMEFTLSDKGKRLLSRLKREELPLPEFLRPLFTDGR